ncbi:MAG: histone deacetylase [Gammaproteobacteria bacterium]|nr:histone deacetylase [Gammaproteobacteria bacterium]
MNEVNRRQFLALSAATVFSKNVTAKSRRTGLVLDERFSQHHISKAHPESPARYQAITQHLLEHNLLNDITLLHPKEDCEKWVKTIHSLEHINAIKTNQPQTHQYALIATGGVLASVDAVCAGKVDNAFCASRPPGHHAKNTGQEEGFCYYNHIAIAARYAQQHYGLKKILIIDWDYHHGNGTEWAFYSDASVLYFSTHDMFAYPGTGFPDRKGEGEGKGFNINVHLGCGVTDDDIIEVFQQSLMPAATKFEPDLILISAGFDSRQDDLLGCHHITDKGFVSLTNMVKMLADIHCDGKIVSLLEGGYNIQGNASAVTAHISALME